MEFFRKLFSSGDFMPHGYCFLWQPALIWLHVVSDTLIALAYFSIPLTLIHFIRKRRHFSFNWVFVCLGVFILTCGATHAMEVWTFWHAIYWLSGELKGVSALASVPTAILLVNMIPKVLAIPSPKALRVEIAERKGTREVEANERSCLVLDVQLLRMSGLELHRELSGNAKAVPIYHLHDRPLR